MELGADWEEGLPWLVLGTREVTQESTGFSPNEVVFAHTVKGPLAAVADNFKQSEPPKSLVDYVNGFRRSLYVVRELAKEKMTAAGLALSSRSELQQVLERRKRVQSDRDEEGHSRTPLEDVLLRRQQKQLQVKYEEVRGESHLMEFVRVRQNLRKIHSVIQDKGANT
uniref:Uncharacterized protein n=1 Tax=Acanthochromis polyacanthus TaxID=80966 RepID=A0A3Q1GBJ9_9TELE